MIRGSTSFEEAQTSIIRLTALVQQVLESHENISKRLANMETPSSMKRNIDSEVCSIDQNRDKTLLVMENLNLGGGIEPADHLKSCDRFSFEPDLLSSRVYVRATIRQSRLLLPNHGAPSVECSLLSDISVAEVSDISVLSLPISASEIWNHHHYATNISPERRLGNSFGTCSPQPEMRLQHIPGKILLLGTSFAIP